MSPTLGLRAWGTSPGSPAGFLGLSGWGKCPPLLSCSPGPGGPLLPVSPILPSASFLWPQDQCGRSGVGGPCRAGDWPGSSAASLGLNAPGDHPPLLSCSSQRVPPACLSWSPQPQGHRSCLSSDSPPPSVPPCPTGSLGGSSCLLGHQGPPPVASRCPSCGESLTQHLPTPPSWLCPPTIISEYHQLSSHCPNFLKCFLQSESK